MRKKITIGIDLNNVYRDLNGAVLKYMQRDFNPLLEPDDLDSKNMEFATDYSNVDESMLYNLVNGKFYFSSIREMEKILYEDYPYEIYGCAKLMERNLDAVINEWVDKNGDDDVEFVFFSTKEIALTIQSTLFFLSKTCSRLRKVFFPKDFEEIWDECDFVVTSDPKFVKHEEVTFADRLKMIFRRKRNRNGNIILIRRKFNTDEIPNVKLSYSSLSEMFGDEELIRKIHEIV